MILLDTNVISELMRPAPNPAVITWLDDQLAGNLYLSAIAKAEIELGIAILTDGKRKDAFLQAAGEIFAGFLDRCLPFDCDAARDYANIVALARKAGRPVSVEDAQIAAIARHNTMALATRNVTDFDFLDGLELINPWEAAP